MPHRSTLCVLALLAAPVAAQRLSPYANGAFPDQPPGSVDRWHLAPASAPLFDSVMDIDPVPRSTRFCVASRVGLVHTFDTTAGTAQKTLLADFSATVARVTDGGFMGVAFHPDFGLQGAPHAEHVYVFYCANDTGSYPSTPTQGFYDCYLRLSRFTVPAGTWTVDPKSELRMLNLRLYNATHRGGDIAFGPDGFLYVPIGDQVRMTTAQSIDDNFDGGILRLCVDADPSRSHAPRRSLPLQHPDEVSGVGYWIPDDNPFCDPSGAVFEEYFAIGLRNPHKIAFDPFGGPPFCADVGAANREEINRLVPGGNYQWPYLEGELPGPRVQPQQAPLGVWTDPVATFDHGRMHAIIGGRVSTVPRLPEILGAYLCADFISGKLLAVTFDPINGAPHDDELLTHSAAGISAFGQGPDGEVYVGVIANGRPLYRLERSSQVVAEPAGRISQLGVFADLRALEPAPGWVPFEPAHPFWSDHAVKRRWIAVPAGAKVRTTERGDWTLPPGTVVMKHFDLPLDRSGPRPEKFRRIETRFLVVAADGQPYGLSYRWLPDGSDALLLTGAAQDTITVQTPAGQIAQDWEYPSRQQCLSCHTKASGGFLGIRTHQLNSRFGYPRRDADHRTVENQLTVWSRLGLIDPPLDHERLADLPRAARLDDAAAPLELRVRSYLDANCAACHRPGTSLRAGFDARFSTPLWAQEIVDGAVFDDLGVAGAKVVAPGAPAMSLLLHRVAATGTAAMPPLGRHVVDEDGRQLLTQWIQGLGAAPTHTNLGNPLTALPQSETWHQSLVINRTDTFTNLTPTARTVRIEAVRLFVERREGWFTPFAVKVLGPEQFAVVATGTPRPAEELHQGFNALPFDDAGAPGVALAPGEELAFGFLDARPDGSGSAPGGIIPYCTCNRGDQVWITGAALPSGTPASIQPGSAPFQGSDLLRERREYAWSVDIVH